LCCFEKPGGEHPRLARREQDQAKKSMYLFEKNRKTRKKIKGVKGYSWKRRP